MGLGFSTPGCRFPFARFVVHDFRDDSVVARLRVFVEHRNRAFPIHGALLHPRAKRAANGVVDLWVGHVAGEPARSVVQAAREREFDAVELRVRRAVQVVVAGFAAAELMEVREAGRNWKVVRLDGGNLCDPLFTQH